jgi:hypothetical protein
MGTRGMDDLVHELRLYGASRGGGEVRSRKFMNAKEKSKKRKKETRTALRPSARQLPETAETVRCFAETLPPTPHRLPDCRLQDPSARALQQ